MMIWVAFHPGKRFLVCLTHQAFVFLLSGKACLQCVVEFFTRKRVACAGCQLRDGFEQGFSCLVGGCNPLWFCERQQGAYHVLCKFER